MLTLFAQAAAAAPAVVADPTAAIITAVVGVLSAALTVALTRLANYIMGHNGAGAAVPAAAAYTPAAPVVAPAAPKS